MVIKFAQGNNVSYDVTKWIVDEESEVATIPTNIMGSTVYVIHTGETWMMDSSNNWYPVTVPGKEPIPCDCVEELTIWSNIPEPTV